VSAAGFTRRQHSKTNLVPILEILVEKNLGAAILIWGSFIRGRRDAAP
jgi:hypothetical protein